ncbi:hypothetical protein IX307_001080 [Bacteroides pyogenes]|nr:hypothetical protein [Bacteroides pyogenes]MBR8708789.1 hypothetical protein [Bacteroides pyogenes]MBR8717582.1 hypothetical protein [Bacteroides pyogenes]MBR8719810.1 hypothetical protein [Bacteroides pyogenes]MBR8724905.1 hypothetical protein [Bacteroides pyogenes]
MLMFKTKGGGFYLISVILLIHKVFLFLDTLFSAEKFVTS